MTLGLDKDIAEGWGEFASSAFILAIILVVAAFPDLFSPSVKTNEHA